MHSREAVEQELATLDFLEIQIEAAEQRLNAIMKVSVEADLLKTLPCVQRIKRSKNHQKAVVAVGRHLAEAAWWVLTKQEVYREPQHSRLALSLTHG